MDSENTTLQENTEAVEQPIQTQEQPKTYTQAEVDALISKTAEKIQQKQAKKTEKTMAQMDAELTQKNALEQQMADMQSQLEELRYAKKEVEATRILSAKGLSPDFVKFVMDTDDGEVVAKIDTLQQLFNSAVNKAVDERLKQPTPRFGNVATLTREAYEALSVKEQNKLYQENKQLIEGLYR